MPKCQSCGTTFTAARSSARYCSDRCRKRASRAPGARLRAVDAPPVGQDAPDGPSPLEDVTRATLAAAGVLDTVSGQSALLLAERVASPEETGSAVAALAKQLNATVDAALASVQRVDALDEVTRKRDEKLRRAGRPS